MKDLVHGIHFFFKPKVQPSTSPQSLPHFRSRCRQDFHSPHSGTLPPYPIHQFQSPVTLQACTVLVLSSLPYPSLNHLYQAVNDWWNTEALFSQVASFTSRPSPNFLFKILDNGFLALAENCINIHLVKCCCSFRALWPPVEGVRTKFFTWQKLANLFLLRICCSSSCSVQRNFSPLLCKKMPQQSGFLCGFCSLMQ